MTFKERERAEELKFVKQAERMFQIRAKRNRMLAIWAAHLLGRDAQEYIRAVMGIHFEGGDQGVFLRLMQDLRSLACPPQEAVIRAKMQEYEAQATLEADPNGNAGSHGSQKE